MQNLNTKWSAALRTGCALGLTLLAAGNLRAAGPFTVNTTDDTHALLPASSPLDVNAKISLRSAIEAANAQAGATTINVMAGTFDLSAGQLVVAPSGSQTLTIIGSGITSTIVKQTDGVNRVFNIDPDSDGGVTVSLSFLAVEGGRDNADNFGGAGILDGSLAATTPDALTLTSCDIEGNHCQALTSSANPGGGVSMEGGNLTVANCTFLRNSSGSSQGAGIYFFPQNIASTLSVTSSLFASNSIADVTGAGIGGSAIYLGSSAATAAHTITSSMFLSNSVTGSVMHETTYGAVQVEESGSANTLTITGSTFVSNSVKAGPNGLGLGAALAVNSGKLNVHYCRLVHNTADDDSIVFSSVDNAASLNATDNWWDCNSGPGPTGCPNITGEAGQPPGSGVTYSPWLKLSFTANPPSVNTGGAATLTASFLTDSGGAPLSAANLGALIGLPVLFNDPVLGTLSAAQPVIQNNAEATVAYTAGNAGGAGAANATVDDVTVTAHVTVNANTLTITTNPADATVCNGETATFTAAASGTPTPTLQWQVSVGGGPFTDIPTATTSPLTFTATTADNGNQYRAVFNNGTVLDSSPATLMVNAPPVAGSDTLGTMENAPVNAPVVKLLANDSSPIGGTLSITAVSASSTEGGTVVLNGPVITYTPPANYFGADSFTYTLSDTRCTAQGTVNVTVTSSNAPSLNKVSITLTGSGRVVLFAGVPGVTYVVQWADAANGPWTSFADGSIVAGPTGLVQYNDATSPIPPTRFYRTTVAGGP